MFSRSGLTHVGRKFIAVTPNDNGDVMSGALGIYVGGAGNISVVDLDGGTTVFTAAPVGTYIPISPKRVNATGTTATGLVLIY